MLPYRLAVYVPIPNSYLMLEIPGKSEIVGTCDFEDPRGVIIDYEGNLSHAANIRTYADRVRAAATRHQQHCPTTARRWVWATEPIQVGWWLGEDRLDVTNMEALTAYWDGIVAPEELYVTEPWEAARHM
ncbi:MAG TPA: hypothetical protein VEP50_00010 [bacterium]|nr:hypothetical protein [bacterium]